MARSHQNSPNRFVLLQVAEAIAPLLNELVFVGGQVAELLITSPGATRVRPTDDVDVIVTATTRGEYHQVEKRLGELGLKNDTGEDAPICRWRTKAGHKLDVMPTDQAILGFGSRWYERIAATAVPYALSPSTAILIPSAPLFIATKWEAFAGRGDSDFLGSHDLEDIISVVAGRPALAEEVRKANADVQEWLAERARDFLEDNSADYAIQGAVPDIATIPEVLDEIRARFARIAAMD